MRKPFIGISVSFVQNKYLHLQKDYCESVYRAGGAPVLIPCVEPSLAAGYLNRIDALLLSGGDDLNPFLYSEKPIQGKVKLVARAREIFDLQLVRLALKRGIPMLGICYGAQLLNVVLGGSLFQHILTQVKTAVRHKYSAHKVYLCEGTLLHGIIGKKSVMTNSFHHQAIKEPGRNLRISARSEDTLIEAIELPPVTNRFCIGVQWHPERMPDNKDQLRLFDAFVRASLARVK